MKDFLDNLPPAVRDPRRLVPGIVALVLLAGAAIYIPSRPAANESADAPRVEAGAGADANGDLPGDGAEGGTATEGTGGADAATGGAGRPGGRPGSSGAQSSGPRTGSGASANPGVRASYQGVTDTDIRVVFAHQPDPCGQDPTAFIGKALPEPDPEASIATAVKYFNKHALDVFGKDLPPDLASQIGKTGFYGRQIKPSLAIDHGQFCPEQSRADAQQAADSIKPFASLGGSDEWDDEMVRRKLLRVTTGAFLDSYFRERRPYLWGPITGATTINKLLSGYAARYLKGQKTIDTGDPTTSKVDRVFGIIYLDTPQAKADVDELQQMMARKGVRIARAVGYEPKLETIGGQATNAILQMRDAGVTTIFMVMDPIAVQFMAQSADSQRYRPEWISNTYGLMDWSLGPRTFMSREQAGNVFGISAYWPSRQVREDDTEEVKAWRAENGNASVPSDWAGWYGSIKLLARGIAMAGPTLTPQAFEKGISAHCDPCSRATGLDPLIGYGPGDYTATDDAHRQRYDPDAPDYAAAKSSWQDGQPPRGAYVYVDGGKRVTSFD